MLAEGNVKIHFDLISNGEFLKESASVNDFLKLDRIIVRTESDRARKLISEQCETLNCRQERIIFTQVMSAEMTKYVALVLLVTNIKFMNEIAR